MFVKRVQLAQSNSLGNLLAGFATRCLLTVAVVFGAFLLPVTTAYGGEAKEPGKEKDKDRRVVVILHNGDQVEGTLLKKDDTHLHMYVGGSVVSLERKAVKDINDVQDAEEAQQSETTGLYSTTMGSVKNVQAMLEEVWPAIVVVRTPAGMGTGWFCNQNGYLITNNHVVSGERSITVTMFRKEGEGVGKKVFEKVRIVALNDNVDLALLKVEEEIDIQYPQLYLGDSAQLQVGDKCFAVGNPQGYERSTSQGIISKAARNLQGRLYLQTTAPIAPGSSGGPLFNERGQVIGVMSRSGAFFDGLGFAIPSKYVKEFLDNVEAFAYDKDNPNSGTQYMEPPVTSTDGKIKLTASDFIKLGHGVCCLTLADINNDGVQEVVFANNNKAEVGIIRLRKKGEKEPTLEDFEDINRLPGSTRFKVDTTPVASRISSLAVADMNGDKRQDIVFIGDIDGLAVLEQKPDGTFKTARKIDDIKAARRRRALRVVDIDRDGKKDILVLGPQTFTIFRGGTKREEFPLNGNYKSRINRFELLDVTHDGKLDLVFFVMDKHYAVYVRPQNAEGNFVEEFPLRSHISGPVGRYQNGKGIRFLTLDKGLNRIRELSFTQVEKPPEAARVPCSLLALPVDPGTATGAGLEMADIDGDGGLELLALDRKKNAFVIYDYGKAGFRTVRSPSPEGVAQCKLHVGAKGRAGVFSLSKKDKIFGVSRVDDGKVSFPRPINTEGPVEFIAVQSMSGEPPSLLWVEEVKTRYYVRVAPADKLVNSAFDGKNGSIDITARTLSFGREEQKLDDYLAKKPIDLAFCDFNADGKTDLVVYWAYSGKESLYIGLGEGRFREIIKQQDFLKEQKAQPLIVADIDADGKKDVLLVKPGFVRVLRVDDKDELYVEQQFNWEFETVSQFALYDKVDGVPHFIAVSGRQAKVVELDVDKGEFLTLASLDLSGLNVGTIKVGDVDGNGKPDVLALGGGTINIALNKPQRRVVESKMVMNAKLDYFRYWNL